MTGSSGTARRSRFSLRSLFGSTPPASFTQFAARLVERQDGSSPHTQRQHSWDAESGTSGPGPETALTGANGGGSLSSHSGRGAIRDHCSGDHLPQQQQKPQQQSMDSTMLECPLCLLVLDRSYFPKLASCSHRACWDCLRRYLRVEILEGRSNIACPECAESVHPNDIQTILNEDVATMAKYETFMLRRVLATDPDARWCPAPDCTFVVVANNCATCPKLKCQRPGCDTEFCYHCKQEWHPNITCDMARQQRQENGEGLFPAFPFASTSTGAGGSGSGGTKLAGKEEMKNCPSCGMQIIKADDGSCNHMICGICGKEFCWLCVKQITDLHYLSPSGCTFWGKKPWSRKKKILWQLGMLVGAPVGIALIAGIAIPGIIIGIPVFVGKKIYAKNRGKSALKRNAAVSLCVLLSMALSPIVATIVVGIGIPILLAYAYGVVPLSLLRSGGCGVKASSSGVRLQFDEGPGVEDHPVEERDKVLESLRDHHSQERPGRGSQIGLSHSASTSSQQHHHHRRSSRTTANSMSGTDDHVSINIGDVDSVYEIVTDSVLSERTQESGDGSCSGVGGSGRLHTITVQMEQDRASQGSTKALAGSLLNYDPPTNEHK